MTTAVPLKLFNSLTRQLEVFQPVHPGEARVYSCGPTVYNYPHIGNMRAYVFADVLGRTLAFKGYKLTHVINITDVGHLTDDADAGEDETVVGALDARRGLRGPFVAAGVEIGFVAAHAVVFPWSGRAAGAVVSAGPWRQMNVAWSPAPMRFSHFAQRA